MAPGETARATAQIGRGKVGDVPTGQAKTVEGEKAKTVGDGDGAG